MVIKRCVAWVTLHRYHQTSSVGTMLNVLNWQPLSEWCRLGRLVMFYKIHYQLVAITINAELMLLTLKQHPIKADS